MLQKSKARSKIYNHKDTCKVNTFKYQFQDKIYVSENLQSNRKHKKIINDYVLLYEIIIVVTIYMGIVL